MGDRLARPYHALMDADMQARKSATPKAAPDAMRPFLDALAGVPETVSDSAPFARVSNDARTPGTINIITFGELRKLCALSAPAPSPDGVQALDAYHLYFALMGLTSYVLANFPQSGQWNQGGVKVVELAKECIAKFKKYDYDAPPSATAPAEEKSKCP